MKAAAMFVCSLLFLGGAYWCLSQYVPLAAENYKTETELVDVRAELQDKTITPERQEKLRRRKVQLEDELVSNSTEQRDLEFKGWGAVWGSLLSATIGVWVWWSGRRTRKAKREAIAVSS